jgi:hypothetical protein
MEKHSKSASPSEPRTITCTQVDPPNPQPVPNFAVEPRRDEREALHQQAEEFLLTHYANIRGRWQFLKPILADFAETILAARASAVPLHLGEILETLKFAQEVIHDQAERFHKGCRCQLCEVLPESLQRAIELLEGSKVAVPQPSARQRQVILHSLREVTQSHQFNDERICGKCNMSDTYTTAFKIMCPSADQTEGNDEKS